MWTEFQAESYMTRVRNVPESTAQEDLQQPLKCTYIWVERPLHQTESITVESTDTGLSTAAFNYSSVVQNAKTAGDSTKEPCNAKRLMRTYLSLPTVCHDYQFAQRAHYSTPASLSQPAKKET